VEYCCFNGKAFPRFDFTANFQYGRHALSYVLIQVTVNVPLVRVKLLRAINGDPDLYSYSCLCECSLTSLTTLVNDKTPPLTIMLAFNRKVLSVFVAHPRELRAMLVNRLLLVFSGLVMLLNQLYLFADFLVCPQKQTLVVWLLLLPIAILLLSKQHQSSKI